MWIFYAELDPTLVLSPTHSDLRRLADSAANFLAPRLARIPRDSGVKHFLTQPGKEGWDIKRKLVWQRHVIVHPPPSREGLGRVTGSDSLPAAG